MFTDYLGNPIKPGDACIYPEQRHQFSITTVADVIPLVPHRDGPGDKWTWPKGELMRADQAGKADPTRFKDPGDPAKAYICQVLDGDKRRKSLSTRHVIVVPDGTAPA